MKKWAFYHHAWWVLLLVHSEIQMSRGSLAIQSEHSGTWCQVIRLVALETWYATCMMLWNWKESIFFVFMKRRGVADGESCGWNLICEAPGNVMILLGKCNDSGSATLLLYSIFLWCFSIIKRFGSLISLPKRLAKWKGGSSKKHFILNHSEIKICSQSRYRQGECANMSMSCANWICASCLFCMTAIHIKNIRHLLAPNYVRSKNFCLLGHSVSNLKPS
jgi:hypothetical protein